MKKIKIDTEAFMRDLRPAADKAVKAGQRAAEKAIKISRAAIKNSREIMADTQEEVAVVRDRDPAARND